MKITFNGEPPFCLVTLAKTKKAKKGDKIVDISLESLKQSAYDQPRIQEKMEQLSKSPIGTEKYIMWEDDHTSYLDICSAEKVIDWTIDTIKAINPYREENNLYCFREDVKDIGYSIQALNSGYIASYQYQYSTRVFKIKKIGEELFALYQLTDYIQGGFV